jgi:ribosome-binding protein aMBF1 (putative translation factor)
MASGQFTRRRILPGYVQCGECRRDLPEADFKTIRRTAKNGSVKTYPNTYCRQCESRVSVREEQRKRQDPAYRANANRKALMKYHRRDARQRKADRVFRMQTVRSAIDRLLAAGWTVPEIAAAIDATPTSVKKWEKGEGRPFRRHADALRLLVRVVEERERLAA